MKNTFLLVAVGFLSWWLLRSSPEMKKAPEPKQPSVHTSEDQKLTHGIGSANAPPPLPRIPKSIELTLAEKLELAEKELRDSEIVERLRTGRLSREEQAEAAKRIRHLDELRSAEIERRINEVHALLDEETK